MQNSIRVLEQIQRIDLEIGALEGEEKGYLKDIERITVEVKAAEEGISSLSAELDMLKLLIQDAQEKIRLSVEKVSKDEKKLSDVKKDKELNALTKEINNANKAKKAVEQELSGLAAKADGKKADLDAKKALLNEKNEALTRVCEELAGKRTGWKEEIEKKNRLRDSVKAGVRPDVLKKYEAIRAKRSGVGMALVKNETCQGCFIHIPPQVYIILKRGTDELMSCPHCHRILYVETQGQSEAV